MLDEQSEVRSTSVPVAMTLGLKALQRYQEFTSAEYELLSTQGLNVRLARFEVVWAEFEKAFDDQKGNAMLSSEQIDLISDCFGKGEEMYLRIKTEICTRLENMKPVIVPGTSSTLPQTLQVQFAEPACVPKFSGNELEWANFRDAFMTEIHANARYTDAQKLRKLLALLEGRAKNAMGTWTTTNDGAYPAALAALCKLYDNEYGTIRAHIQRVFALKSIQQASRDGLREVLDTVRSAQRQLLLLLPAEQLGEYILLHQIELTLDTESQAQWGMRRTTESLPTLDQMFQFLELRASLMANIPRPGRSFDDPRRPASTATSIAGLGGGRGNEPLPKCDLCQNQHHWPFRCPKFRSMILVDRLAYIAGRKMCHCCFSLKHAAVNCSERPCPRCNVRHNSCLCPQNQRVGKPTTSKPEPNEPATSRQ